MTIWIYIDVWTHIGGILLFQVLQPEIFYWGIIERLISFVRRVKEQFNYVPTTPIRLTLDGEYCQILLCSREISMMH